MYDLYMDLYRQAWYNRTIMEEESEYIDAPREVKYMPERSDALKKAQQKYMEKFSVARVRMEHDRYERVQAHAEARGESVNGFINRAISETMERDGLEGRSGAAGAALRGGVSLP